MRENFSFLNRLYRYIYPTVYVYQMGKVGSSSLEKTLRRKIKGAFARAHVHSDMSDGWKIKINARIHLHLPINVICPIREPISRNVSAFFQNFKRDTGFEFSDRKFDMVELKRLFLECHPHNEPLEWFDRHMRPVFGIDVYQKKFPVERKWKVYAKGSTKVLIYRSDLDRSTQLEVISDFLKINCKKWEYDNVSEDKEYKVLYNEFNTIVRLPELYLKLMNGSIFAKHFWSDDEREINSNRWRIKESIMNLKNEEESI